MNNNSNKALKPFFAEFKRGFKQWLELNTNQTKHQQGNKTKI